MNVGKNHFQGKIYRVTMAALLFFCFSKTQSQQKGSKELATTISTKYLLRDTADIVRQLGIINSLVETNTDSAITLALHVVESSKQLKYTLGIATSLYYTGLLYQIKGKYALAIKTLQLAIPYCGINPKGNDVLVKTLSAIADVYASYGKADSAAYFYYQILDEIEKRQITDPELLVDAYSSVITLWLNLNDSPVDFANDKYMQNAASYLNKIELISLPSTKIKTRLLFSKGHLKKLQKDFDSARYFYKEMFGLIKQGSMKKRANSWASAMLINISDLFLEQQNADSALWYAKAALRELPPKGGTGFRHYVIGNYYIGKALTLQKKYKEAIAVTLPALNTARQNKDFFLREMAYEILAEAYRETGNFQEALKQQIAYSNIRDSQTQKAKIMAISQMEMKYQVADNRKKLSEKELDIVKKDQSIKEKNSWIAAIATSLILLLLMAVLWYRQHSHRQRMLAFQALQQQQINTLQATINGEEKERNRMARELHDGIGGMLGAIQIRLGAAIRESDPNNSTEFVSIHGLVGEAYTDLRRTAHNLMPEALRQQGLIQAVQLFCEGVSKGAPPIVDFEAVGDIPTLSPGMELAIYRIVQELVNNILKHARATNALVQLAYAHSTLTLTIEDDGIGIDPVAASTKGGLGIRTIRERVNAMGGKIDISGRAIQRQQYLPGISSGLKNKPPLPDKTMNFARRRKTAT